MLQLVQPNVRVAQITSEYRDDGREVLRCTISKTVHLDLVEDDLEWFAVVAMLEQGAWDLPGKRAAMPLGIRTWARLEDVAEAYWLAIGEVLQIAAKYDSMSETELDEFFDDQDSQIEAGSADGGAPDEEAILPPEPKLLLPNKKGIRSASQSRSFRWVGVVVAIVIALLLFGGCGPVGWQMGKDGDGYRVQCSDGSWSNSGGKSGACSWHGGVG